MSYSVLHLSYADNDGGAARSAYKIHQGLQQLGWDSRMLVKNKVTQDPFIANIQEHQRWLQLGDAVSRKVIDRLLSLENWYYPSSTALSHHPWFHSAHVLQLHNLHPHFFSYRVLPHLSKQKPIVWRLPDMWAFTGHCTYSYSCDRWQIGCGNCPQLDSYPPLRYDTTTLLWHEKQRIYQKSNLAIVVTNSWMESLAKKSPLLTHLSIRKIENGINTKIFQPISKAFARGALRIPDEANVILFTAADTTESRKGGQYVPLIMEALVKAGITDLVLIVLGKGAETWKSNSGYSIIALETTISERFLAIAYSAADVLLHPALVENLPNTILEGMACGLPCAAFDIGGIADIIETGKTGYLAKYQDVEDLIKGVLRILIDNQQRAKMSSQCLDLIKSQYTLEGQAKKFAQLYEELINECPKI